MMQRPRPPERDLPPAGSKHPAIPQTRLSPTVPTNHFRGAGRQPRAYSSRHPFELLRMPFTVPSVHGEYNFGRILGTQTAPRVGELGLKLLF
jgi:hypothetical protein